MSSRRLPGKILHCFGLLLRSNLQYAILKPLCFRWNISLNLGVIYDGTECGVSTLTHVHDARERGWRSLIILVNGFGNK